MATKTIQITIEDDDFTDDNGAYGRTLEIEVELNLKEVPFYDSPFGPLGKGLRLEKVKILHDTGTWFPTDQDGVSLPDFPYESFDFDESIIEKAEQQFSEGHLSI